MFGTKHRESRASVIESKFSHMGLVDNPIYENGLVIKTEWNAENGGGRVSEVGEQRHKHSVPNQRKQRRIQSRGIERGTETKLREALRVRRHNGRRFQT